MSPDPTFVSDGLHLYAYVGNGPVNYTDPSGNWRQAGRTIWRNGGRTLADWTPILGDGLAIRDAWNHPTALGIAAAGVGLVPLVGDGIGKILRHADEVATGFKGSKGFELGNPTYQPGRNAPGEVNGIPYSGHALDQMQNRGIMPSVVQNTIETGVASPGRAGAVKYYDSVNNVQVVVNPATMPCERSTYPSRPRMTGRSRWRVSPIRCL